MGKSLCGHRAAVSVDVYILVPSTVVRRKRKEMLLEQSQVQEEEMLLCKVSDLWSLLKKDRVTMLPDLKETQLSNPQKYKFYFSPRGSGARWGEKGS